MMTQPLPPPLSPLTAYPMPSDHVPACPLLTVHPMALAPTLPIMGSRYDALRLLNASTQG